ncbi:MAG: hypothetical protein Q4G24_08690 [Paracoccus sp. (in: a-proteobacteria)]|nr:hypothetical protein [Paracoccus sp. (in: a-proteobacteria)]MDO5621531.1 hypothetical protein [Paracoccus sp. (in: a-proteobacteria)]
MTNDIQKAKAAEKARRARAVLEQMYGYYDYEAPVAARDEVPYAA